jgi:hypothetical protein
MLSSNCRRVLLGVGFLVAFLVTGCFLAVRALDRFAGNAPVEMYGRIVDDMGSPLPGVRVTARMRAVRLASHPLFPRLGPDIFLTAVSDADGRFSFRASSGKYLVVGPFEKPGWRPSPTGFRNVQQSFEYPLLGYEYPPGARKRPDNPDDPIVYPMIPAEVATVQNNPN